MSCPMQVLSRHPHRNAFAMTVLDYYYSKEQAAGRSMQDTATAVKAQVNDFMIVTSTSIEGTATVVSAQVRDFMAVTSTFTGETAATIVEQVCWFMAARAAMTETATTEPKTVAKQEKKDKKESKLEKPHKLRETNKLPHQDMSPK